MLAYTVAGFGLLIAIIGMVILIAPAPVRAVMESMRNRRALYGAIAVRIVMGAFFVFASDACAWPQAIGTLGVVMLAAGFAGLFIGPGRLRLLMTWFDRLPDSVWRLLSLFAIGFGAFVVYAAI